MAGEEGGLGSRSIEEIFGLLDSTNPDIVSEIQRLFYENLSESRDPWLVCGLYDHHAATGSPHSLKLLVSVKEPQDKLLCDRSAVVSCTVCCVSCLVELSCRVVS